MNPKVDFYFDKAPQWQPELRRLRALALECGLEEVLKWGVPCYTFQGRNVALLHYFKEYCALLFPKGALLADTHGLLVQQTVNVQVGRQIRFVSLAQVIERQADIKAYLYEAIEVERAGVPVRHKTTAEYEMPDELREMLAADSAFAEAFEALTPGRQRAYILHFAGAKQAKTRAARIEKHRPNILAGRGLNE